jgi:uncharacterized protein (DUF488 family)
MMKINTIGFTKKNAQTFFNFIKNEKVTTLIDVRLNNVSQLAGYAKRDDLKFFLKEICDTDYLHIPDLAPTKEILNGYKKGGMSWERYEDNFLNLMAQRNIERILKPTLLNDSCLLCSEHEPHFCHRRLVVEYLNEHTDQNYQVKHLY